MFVGQLVTTPYGNGFISKIRIENDITCIIVTPTDWTMDRNQKSVLYMNPKDVKPKFLIDSKVQTQFGTGVIQNVRDEDGIYVVTLDNWFLATNTSPKLFLNQSSISEIINIPNESQIEKLSYFHECIKKSKEHKSLAEKSFKMNDFDSAKSNYILALEVLRYIDVEHLGNEDKARILEQSIPTHNNVALCCMKLKNFNECVIYAKNVCLFFQNIFFQFKLN